MAGQADRIPVSIHDLPFDENFDLPAFDEARPKIRALPPPGEVREQAEKDGVDITRNTFRPPPVRFPDLGMIVKWGSDVSIAEGQCFWFMNKHLADQVPVPKIYGWARDGGQTFLYMELVSGDPLSDRWPTLCEKDRSRLCDQLRSHVASWQRIEQQDSGARLCQLGGQALRDIMFHDACCGSYPAGPFANVRDFHDCFAKLVVRNRPEDGNPRESTRELKGLTDDAPVVFAHNDLDQSNILISRAEDGPLRITAIIDWHQAGWYPQHWERLKAQSVGRGLAPDWVEDYLPRILDPAPYDYYYAWEYISMSTI